MKDAIVIVVHGSYGTNTFLRPITEYLSEKGVLNSTVILPWHTKPFEKQIKHLQHVTLKDYVEHVEKVVQKHVLQHPHAKIIFLGYSMGTSIIDQIIAKDPEKYSGVIYLAPAVGLSLFGLVRLCLHYREVLLKVVLGRSHIVPFHVAKKAMMNTTLPGKAGSIYSNITYESGKVLREVFFFRRNVKNSVPKFAIFGKSDNTIMKKTGPNTTIVEGDHIGMINNSKELVFEFIQQILKNNTSHEN